MGARTKEEQEKQEQVEKLALKKAEAHLDTLEKEANPYEDPNRWEGLSKRQKTIVRYKMRGMSQTQIGEILKISQPSVSQELSKIRKMQRERVVAIDQNVVVGESLSVYEEVRDKGWAIYSAAQKEQDLGAQAKALSVVMAAQKEQNKLLMELGVLQRAAKEVNINHELPPLLKDWKDGNAKDRIVVDIIDTQLSDLEEPEPPILGAELEEPEPDED